MYRYDEFDERFVRERVAQFSDQVSRRLDGSLTEDEFKPLRLKNGVYLQLHAYMLRIAVPYGTLNSRQLRQLALIGETYDRGYGHFTTRTNIQFNWPKLRDVPEILDLLAEVEMHCIQTSGNCIRNVTADHFAGVAQDEIEDPRPTAELIRQWSSAHPEFSYLPRKFKIAVTGAEHDRAGPRRPARQQVQGARQDPGPRDRRRGIHPPRRGRVRAARRPVDQCRSRRAGAHRRLFRTAVLRDAAGREQHAGSGQGDQSGLRPLGRGQYDAAQMGGLHRADDLAEAARPGAGRRDQRADAPRRRSGRALFLRRVARHPCAEPRAAACAPARSPGNLAEARRGRV